LFIFVGLINLIVCVCFFDDFSVFFVLGRMLYFDSYVAFFVSDNLFFLFFIALI